MAEISKITALDGTTYDLKDITARQNIPFGIVDSTSTATAFTATVPGITSLEDGTCMLLKNGVVTSASGFTININNLGAKPAYSNMSAATAETTLFNENYTMLFVYDSTRVEGGAWILYRGYNSNDNTIGYQLRTNSSKLKSSDACRYYKIFFTSADGTTFVPASATKTNNATTAIAVNQRPINPFGSIIYYSTTTNFSAGTALSATAMWEQYTVTLGYSFNTTGAALTLTVDAPVYVKCAPQTDGSAIIDSTNPIVQSLPTSADGKIYIFLGLAYSATAIELNMHHPVYYHDGSGIKLWNGTDISAATTAPVMDGTAAVGTSTKYAREDHVHPSDMTRVAKSGDTMSGTLTLAANKYYDQNTTSGLNANNSDIIGLNGIYMNDAAEDGREGINFPNGSNWDSLYANGGKLWFSPNRAKGDSQGTEGARELYSRPLYELGTTDIGMRPMVSWARANRLVFLPADQIIIEQTVDGGTTWTSSNVSDANKLKLFSDMRPTIALPRINDARSELCGLRVTFTAMKYDVPSGTAETNKYQYWNKDHVLSQERYTNLREMWFWLGSNGDLLRCQIECATGANPNTWVTQFDKDVGLIGWSGSDWVRWTGGPTFGGATNQTGNYWNWRVTFWSKKSNTGVFTQTSIQSIYSIAGYGDGAWGTPNGLMKYDHLYTYDENKNATFPAKVTATSFTGDLIGNSTGVSTSGNATNSTARHVWFSDADTKTKRAYNNNFKYTPSTNTISSNISGSAAKVNNHTVNSDVPANAVFTDTINTYYGECSSSAYEVEKLVDCDDFTELIAGATINVLFYNVNLALNATLNVNDTGAKKITLETLNGTTADSGLNWPAGVVSFTYDGFTWHLHNPSRLATSTSSGLMSYTDKSKLDNLNKFYLTDTTPASASSGDLWFIIEEEETIIPGQGDQNASEPSYP